MKGRQVEDMIFEMKDGNAEAVRSSATKHQRLRKDEI